MNLFVLTGAGVSAESGLKTFRDPGGLWENHDPMSLATPEAFAHDPALVHRFYNWRRATAAGAAPNPAHHALAKLERDLAGRGDAMTLVTQNVDYLHERAGSTVIAMHGTHTESRCMRCGDIRPWDGDMGVDTRCPACQETGGLRPNIVWFGEMPHHLDLIAKKLEAAIVFAAIGTSGAVYPAAAYVRAARGAGIVTCELNLTPADNARQFEHTFYGKATVTVPAFCAKVLAGDFG